MIIIGADIVPTASNIHHFENGAINELVDDQIQTLINNADYRILNLEVPLTDKKDPITKCGPNLIASTRSVEAIRNMKIDLLTLANNHIMDQGIQGLLSTKETLNKANISYVGVGNNVEEASKPFFFTVNGIKYGVYACAEHEFSIAREDYPGANPFDPLESPDHIEQLKNECDYVIVLYHGGKEHYRYPSPDLQKTCRKLIEKGANLVVCQHSHCIGCKEEYLNGTIVYGQGNFLFDSQDNEYWNSGLLVCLKDNGQIEYVPIKKDGHKSVLATEADGEEIINGFIRRSNEIMSGSTIDDKYRSFADENYMNYMMHFSGMENSFVFKAINKLSGQRLKQWYIKRYTNEFGSILRNFIECEAHRELIIQALKNREN